MTSRSRARDESPNILLIVGDTFRCDGIGAYGSSALSPSLDRLAAEGVRFDDCRTPSPVCCPARSSLLTGQYPVTHGCTENGVERREGMPVFTDALREAGYHTIYVGKTHWGPDPAFDDFHMLRGEKNADNDDFYARHVRALGHSRATRHLAPNPVPAEDFVDAFCARRTIECLERAPTDRPWFACCSLLSPHGPYDPPRPWDTLYADRPLPDEDAPLPRLADEAAPIRRLLGFDKTDQHREDPHARRLYYGLCAYVDAQVGRLVDWLDTRGLREDTLVIFTSDHGYTQFADGYSNKHTFRPTSWRVPLIVSRPGAVPAGEARGCASWVDLTTGILGVAGIDVHWCQGLDILTPLGAGDDNPRRAAIGNLMESFGLATERWVYEWHPESDEERLFDRAADPHELHDLSASPSHAPVRAACLRACATWRALVDDQAGREQRFSPGGPVARRVVAHYQQTPGNLADLRLQEAATAIDAIAPL
jgi:arylsulfatase A-like enzyme